MNRYVSGFNLLRALTPQPARGRILILGLLCGAACGALALQFERRALDQARTQAEGLQSQLDAMAPGLKLAQARAQALAARHAEAAQHQSTRLQLQRLLAVWQALAIGQGVRLTQLHWDAQGLLLQGQGQAAHLPGWAAECAAAVPGLGPLQLVELATAPSASAASSPSIPSPGTAAQSGGSESTMPAATPPIVRFVLRFPEASRP